MNADTERNCPVNVKYIQKALLENIAYTEKTKNLDVVLVLGNTGVGKSTLCNYLAGKQMQKSMHRSYKKVIDTVDGTDIKIGHEVESTTLYAKAIKIDLSYGVKNDRGICLLDCPGFFDNRTVEDCIIESISTEMAIRNAAEVKGILILISYLNISTSRLIEFRQLVKTLISLFKEPVEMAKYSIFVITYNDYEPEEWAKNATIGALTSLKLHCLERAKYYADNQNLNPSDGLTGREYEEIAEYFTAVLERQDNIVLINYVDGGTSRKLIFDRINGIEPRVGYFKKYANKVVSSAKKYLTSENVEKKLHPISIDDFNFSSYDDERQKFNTALYAICCDGYFLIQSINECKEICLNYDSKVVKYKEKLSSLEKFHSDLIKDFNMKDSEKKFESLKQYQVLIDDNNKDIALLKIEVKSNDKLKKELNEKLQVINNDNKLIFIRKGLHKTVNFFKIFGWEKLEFEAITRAETIPIIAVEKEMENGKWYDECDERKKGRYKITYKSDYHARPAEALVTAYIKTKDDEGNAIRITQINNEIKNIENKNEKLKANIEKIEFQNKLLHAHVEMANSNYEAYKNNLRKQIEECERDIEYEQCMKIQEEENAINAKIKGLSSLENFNKKRCEFDLIVSVADILKITTALIKQFISMYQDCLSNLDNIKNVINACNVVKDSTPKQCSTENNSKYPSSSSNEILLGTRSSLTQEFVIKGNIKPSLVKTEEGTEYLNWMRLRDISILLNNQQNQKIDSKLYKELDINGMSLDELQKHKDELLKANCTLKEQLELNEVQLHIVDQQLFKIQSESSLNNLNLV